MPISFLNVPESDELNTSRPTGYKFPTGLTQTELGGPTLVDYLVVAGGAGGAGYGGDNVAGGGGGAGGYRTASDFGITNGITKNKTNRKYNRKSRTFKIKK